LHNVGKANGYLFAQKLKRSDFICAATYIFQKRKGQTKYKSRHTKILNVELFIFVLGLPYVCASHDDVLGSRPEKQKQKWQIDTTRFYLKTCCCLPARYFSTWFKTTYKAFPIIRNLSTRVNKQTSQPFDLLDSPYTSPNIIGD
jgi:hypothetical protein